MVLTHPDATLPEHVARLAAVTDVSLQPLASQSTPSQTRPAAQKKSRIAVERDEAARAAWRAAMAGVDPARLVFLDETSTPTTLTPLRARAARGQRAYGRIPRGRREAISWLATLTPTGLGESLLSAGGRRSPRL